ncbi:MAG: RNA methyltransferase [Rhizobiaceae bacterium]
MSNSKQIGRIEEITSPSNPRMKSIKALAMKKNRDRENVFLVEGQKLVTDALETGWNVRTLIHSKNMLEDEGHAPRITALATKVREQGGDVFITTDKILTSITRRDNAQAVVAVMEQKLTPLSDVIGKGNECWLALDRVRDPGNLGTIIRTADALGAKGVLLVGETTDPFGLEAVRATMGSLFHMKLARANVTEFLSLAERWKTSGGQVTGTHLKGAVDHRSIDYSGGPQLLLMGNEQQGLTDELANACSKLALISMDGAADSLNLAVATGIMLFEARRHRLKQTGDTT